jgi:hypothetical protein
MIDPKLLVVKPVDELEEVNSLQPGSLLFYDGTANLKRIDTDLFYQLLNNIARPIAPADSGPFTANRWYKPTTSGTFANAGGLVSQEGFDTLFWFDGTTWTKTEIELPKFQNIPAFENLTFPAVEGVQSIYQDGIWQVNEGKISTTTDFPTDDSIIWKRIGDKPKNVDTDVLFDTTTEETTVKQPTATGTVSNSSVGTVYGVSASIGIVPAQFNKVTISFAQNLATLVTEIEIRLFQGKTIGGTLIAKKRQTVSTGSVTQASVVINFDSPIEYNGEMWCQILMNNPFAYKRVSPATQRTAAAGYGQPFVSTTNNLDATSFPTSQGYIDLYLEFNTLQSIIATTVMGEDVIISSITEKIVSDVTGDYTGANAYLDATGTIITSGNWRTSELISVTPGKTYTYQGSTAQSTAAVCMVGYNISNVATVLVGNSDHFTTPIDVVIPVGIVKVRICGYVSTPPTLKISEQKIFPSLIPSEISGKISINKVWHCVGHSIWAQDGIVYSGTSTIAEGMQTLIRRIYKFNGYNKYCYSGRSLGATAPSGDTNSITNYFSTWTDNRDGIWSLDSITNDFKRDIPIGTIADYNNATGVMTYYGALRAFNDKVQSLTPGATVFSFNALRRNNGGYTSTSVNAAGHTLLDYEKAIMTISALNGWRFIDQFRQSEVTDETLSITTLDGLHPNNFGYTLAVKPTIRAIGIYISEKV